jgi:hypothetical protein
MALFEFIGIKEIPIADIEDDLLVGIDEEAYTILHCKFTTSAMYDAGWWVNIRKTSHLQNRTSTKKLAMLHAIGIPYAPEKHYLKNRGDCLNFTLIFPKIPDHWKAFDFIEDDGTGNGLMASAIKRNRSGIYRVVVT